MLNRLWGELIIDELSRCGCRTAWICPGARSAPLSVAAARSKTFNASVCIDERAASYQALNAARASGKPTAVICTSGTATANFLPAVIEGMSSGVPLLLITADRPPELRDTGANQTIDQSHLFGNGVAWRFDLPVPDARIDPAMVLTTVDQAVHRSRVAAAPVHLNCMFAEPLLSEDECTDWDDIRTADRPYTTYSVAPTGPSEEAVDETTTAVRAAVGGVLTVGPLPASTDRSAVTSLASTLGWPVIADIQSGVRFGWADWPAPSTVQHHDLVLGYAGFTDARPLSAPDVIVHLGGRLTSKAYLGLLGIRPPAVYVHVTEHPRRIDPEHIVTNRIQAAPDYFCTALDANLRGAAGPGAHYLAGAGAKDLIDAGHTAARAVTAVLGAEPDANEPALAADLIELLPPGWGAYGGSSMPVRDLDTFAEAATWQRSPLVIGANRGASGIDGAIASAVGYACGLNSPVAALVGDLAILHDLGSLSLLARSPQPVVLAIANNNGGGIFSFLPSLTSQDDVFERYFATPHGYHFEHVCRMFDLDYHQPRTRTETREVLRQCFATAQSAVIEITTDRKKNLALHRKLRDEAGAAIKARNC